MGPAGTSNRLDMHGTFDASGFVERSIPAESVAGDELPVLECYESSDASVWLVVDHLPTLASGYTFCGLVGTDTNQPTVQISSGLDG